MMLLGLRDYVRRAYCDICKGGTFVGFAQRVRCSPSVIFAGLAGSVRFRDCNVD